MARLDPQSAALLELSESQGLSDEEIADVLHVKPDEVRRRREAARAELEQVVGESRSRRRRLAGGGALLLVGALAVGAVVASSGDEEGKPARAQESTPTRAETQPAARRPETSATQAETTGTQPERPGLESSGPGLSMQRLNGTNGRGSAQVLRRGRTRTLRLRADSFLAPQGGGYAVWLYTSKTSARRLYATKETTISLDLPLPRDISRFAFFEVARAVPDLESEHSGLSLLRVPTKRLLGSG